MSAQQPAGPAAPAQPPQAPDVLPPPAPTLPGDLAASVQQGIPRTIQELGALRTRREELSNQLVSATSRRNALAQRLHGTMEGPDRVGLEQRIQFLDHRILQLESDIAVTGEQISSAPASLLATQNTPFPGARSRGGMSTNDVMALGTLTTLLVFVPLAVAAARLMWRRATHPAATRDPETAKRLASLETAVDTIAVEIERVAEGQRFLTRLLAEPHDGRQLDALLPEEGRHAREAAMLPTTDLRLDGD